MAIQFLDMFAGIGGFRSGLERIGGFSCVGFCEIDKHAGKAYRALYNTEGEYFCDDATKINTDELPDIDLICAGFPCQPFSVAGLRQGFDDTRGTLFHEIVRMAEAKQPRFLLLENVPGLLSHQQGKTFGTILTALSELGYSLEWGIVNSKNFGVPQSRRRLYIVGFLGGRGAGEVFPVGSSNAKNLIQLLPGPQGQRVYSTDGIACTQCAGSGGWGGKTGLYFIDMNPNPQVTEHARCITARQDSGIGKRRGEHSGVLIKDDAQAVITPDRETIRQQGRRIKEPGEPMFTITAQDRHGVLHHGRIRRLIPLECWRLQGYTDEQFYTVQNSGIADGQLYKMAGNSVTVHVVSAFGERLKEINQKYYESEGDSKCQTM